MATTEDFIVAEGIQAVREWAKGRGDHLDRWEKLYLGYSGSQILGELNRNLPDDQMRAIITRAVRAGF